MWQGSQAIAANAQQFDKPMYGRTLFHDEVRVARREPAWEHVATGIGAVMPGVIRHRETGQLLKFLPGRGWVGIPQARG